jgi:ABC-type transport system involved in multi-copper enzyme maturation permease subunit
MKQELIKEFRYGVRNSRFLILAASFLFYALLTPVMLKIILPEILKSQFPGMGADLLGQMIDMTQSGSLQSYIGDIFELGTIIVAFTLCGLLAQDIRDNTLVMPLCSGKSFHGILFAKFIMFGLTLLIIPVIALCASFVYSGLLFGFEVNFSAVLLSGLYQGLYLIFLLSLILLLGTLISKPVATGLLALGITYIQNLAGGLFNIKKYLPAGLITSSVSLSTDFTGDQITSILITLALIVLIIGATLMRLRQMEWNLR